MALKYPDILKSNNPSAYGIVDAKEVAGHRTVKTLDELYALPAPILSLTGDNTDNDAIGQVWYVSELDTYYRLTDWDNRSNSGGWVDHNKKLNQLKTNFDALVGNETAIDGAINTFKEIELFLADYEGSDLKDILDMFVAKSGTSSVSDNFTITDNASFKISTSEVSLYRPTIKFTETSADYTPNFILESIIEDDYIYSGIKLRHTTGLKSSLQIGTSGIIASDLKVNDGITLYKNSDSPVYLGRDSGALGLTIQAGNAILNIGTDSVSDAVVTEKLILSTLYNAEGEAALDLSSSTATLIANNTYLELDSKTLKLGTKNQDTFVNPFIVGITNVSAKISHGDRSISIGSNEVDLLAESIMTGTIIPNNAKLTIAGDTAGTTIIEGRYIGSINLSLSTDKRVDNLSIGTDGLNYSIELGTGLTGNPDVTCERNFIICSTAIYGNTSPNAAAFTLKSKDTGLQDVPVGHNVLSVQIGSGDNNYTGVPVFEVYGDYDGRSIAKVFGSLMLTSDVTLSSGMLLSDGGDALAVNGQKLATESKVETIIKQMVAPTILFFTPTEDNLTATISHEFGEVPNVRVYLVEDDGSYTMVYADVNNVYDSSTSSYKVTITFTEVGGNYKIAVGY